MTAKKIQKYALLSDTPVGEAGRGDSLKFSDTAEILSRAAIDTGDSITIGVFGEWGAGKTSLMRLMQEKVEKENLAVAVWFNAWQYEKEDHLIVPLVATIKKKLESDLDAKDWEDSIKEGAKKIRDALRAVAYGFSIKGKVGIPLVSEAEVNLSPKDMIERYQDLIDKTVLGRSLYFDAFERFEQCTKDGAAPRIVVFVDDLDRCFPKNALELLEHIKLVLNQRGFTFVLGINEKAIQAAVKVKSQQTTDFPEDYLDKIVQVMVRVPKRKSGEMNEYIGGLLDKGGVFPEDLKGDLVSLIAEAAGRNPRSIVRLLNRIIVTYRIGEKEGKQYDILSLVLHFATDESRFENFRNALGFSILLEDKTTPTVGEYLSSQLTDFSATYQNWIEDLRASDIGGRKDEFDKAVDGFVHNEHLFNLLKSDEGLKWLRDSAHRRSLDEMAESTVSEGKREEKAEEDIEKKAAASKTEGSIRQLESWMVAIEGDEFEMGDGLDDDNPVHTVRLDAFEIGAMPVTQAQYEAIMGVKPSHFEGPDRPVESVSWDNAMEFCKRLSEKTGRKYTLPTEAQWEYACRAESKGKYCFGDDESQLGEFAWYGANSDDETHPVGMKKPNNWGLYDMHGNVWEWCHDWYDEDYYNQEEASDNPRGPSEGSFRVNRGGSWSNTPQYCRSACRNSYTPGYRSYILGFRVLAVPAGDRKAGRDAATGGSPSGKRESAPPRRRSGGSKKKKE